MSLIPRSRPHALAAEMARELGLHKRGQLDLGRYVNHLRDEPVLVSQNGDRP